MCRDGHEEIGFSGDDELCPLCIALAQLEMLTEAAEAVVDSAIIYRAGGGSEAVDP